MEVINSQSVAIDGDKIRSIREEKKLTQLYVSKVVGVTTDTVSRWENNRYPTIMKDNAIKLADALEVDLDSILKQEEIVEEVIEPTLPQNNNLKWLYALVIIVGVLCFYLFVVSPKTSEPVPVLVANRVLPSYAAPGSEILVQVELSVEKDLKGMILKESFPIGWKLLDSEPKVSHFDSSEGVARWIFRKPLSKTKVFYLLQVPTVTEAGSVISISGELIANPDGHRSVAMVESLSAMQVKPVHWVDGNGDNVIDDLEILDLYDLTEPIQNMDLGWDLVEEIWESDGYQWHKEEGQFVPIQKSLD